jgi:hypothetical protein
MKKMRRVLLALLLSVMADAGATDLMDHVRRKLGPDDNAVFGDNQHTIYVLGVINPGAAREFKAVIDHGPAIDTVIVDSPGGDVSSAVDIANLIHRRKLNIVVDGRCFSACANYLFPAGHSKSLRPQSFLGIHNRTYNYVDDGVARHAVQRPEIHGALNKSQLTRVTGHFAELAKKESAFFATINMSTNLDKLFSRYLERRELARSQAKITKAKGAEFCPSINLWVLRREQLESIGVKNIGEFWEPRTPGERAMLQLYFKVPPAESFFGSAAELESLCAAPARPSATYRSH